jgi:mannitol 2-dehydrogenase
VKVGIVHLGFGGFHRSHQAMLVDRLMQQGLASDWAICGVGTRLEDRPLAEAMGEQDCLYTLAERHPDGTRALRVIGSVAEYLFAPDDPAAVIERMTDPAVRVVSLTVTEGGYFLDQVRGGFDAGSPEVVADAAGGEPTVFGMIARALRARRQAGHAPFTVMSCDNIPGNGDVARDAVVGVAAQLDPELARWIDIEVAFPNSMVDRITPRTTDDDRRSVNQELGVADECPVVCEPFWQWVLEDRFPLGRPPFERAGVQLVDDVEPYELMKLRLLNVTHQGMCYFGALAGIRFVHEAVAEPTIRELLRRYMDEEATPTLPPVPGIDLDAYKASLLERYGNPYIRDTLARLCAESSDRIPKWLLPVVRIRLEQGVESPLSAAIVASWARYDEGVDDAGRRIDVVDSRRDELMALAEQQAKVPLAFLNARDLFGELREHPQFTEPYTAALELLHEGPALEAIERILASTR